MSIRVNPWPELPLAASCEVYAVEGANHAVGTWERNPAFQGYKQKVPQWLRAQFGLNRK